MAAKSVPDDNATLTRYKEAFRMCYGKMPHVLPIKHFIIYLVERGQLRSSLKSHIQAKETREEQVQCLLDDIQGGLEAGYTERFDALILAVREYASRENLHELNQLSDDIQRILQGTAPKPLVDPHESSLREEFKELNIEMHTGTVGVALLVSNDYATLGTNRELSFTHKDADSMEQLFMEFGYMVYRKKNVSSDQFMSCQKKLVEFKYPLSCRRFLVYFSGQGEDGSLLMQDSGIIPIDNMVAFFGSTNKNLAKIFLIDVQSHTSMVKDCYPITTAPQQGGITCLQRIPKVVNTLVVYACTQYCSASEVTVGRRWSDCLTKALRESTERDSICYILTRAKQLITELQCHNVVADFTNNLACEVYLKREVKQCKIHDHYCEQSSHQQRSQYNNRQFSIPFSAFLAKVMRLLDKHCDSDKLELCKGFCCTLKHSDDCNEPLFNDKDVKKIDKCKNFKELFYSPLRRHYGWNQLDIVEHIVRMSELDEAEDELKKYNQHISSNKGTEIVSDFVYEDKLPPEAIKVSVIQERPHSKKLTVGEYQESGNAIFEPLKVKPYTPYSHVIFSLNSLHLLWYVPAQAAEHMKKMAKINESLLMKQSVVFIKIGNDVIFDHRLLKQQPEHVMKQKHRDSKKPSGDIQSPYQQDIITNEGYLDNSLKRNILVIGSSGSGKSSLINNIIGEDCLPIQHEFSTTPTITAQQVHRELLINNNKYQCNFIELHIPDELIPSSSSVMIFLPMQALPHRSPFYSALKDQIVKYPYLREYLERLNLIIYVTRAGHLAAEYYEALQAYMNIFSWSISALVVTHCDHCDDAGRTRVVEELKLTRPGFMAKGIYTVGFPDVTKVDDTVVKSSLKSKIQDVSKLHQLIEESSDMVWIF